MRHQIEHRANHLVGDQPRDEQVQSLEGVEADGAVVAKAVGGEHHDGRDPADPRDVAKDRRRLGVEGFQAAAYRVGRRATPQVGARRIGRSTDPPAPPGFRIGYKMASTTPYESRRRRFRNIPCAGHANIFAMKLLLNAVLLLATARLLPAAKNLEIYFIDVEGGQATLMVPPGGESMLVDTGWGGFNRRDAERIAAAAKKAGVKRIDYLLITHFHSDHVGGVAQLAEKLPIRNFVDHGTSVETGQGGGDPVQVVRRAARQGQAHPGEARRYDSDQGPRRARGVRRWPDDRSAARGRRQAEPGVRRVSRSRMPTSRKTRSPSDSSCSSAASAWPTWAT